VGSNVPPARTVSVVEQKRKPTIGVFAITERGAEREIEDLAFVVRSAAEQLGQLRLVILGRGSGAAEHKLRQKLGAAVDFECLGIVTAEQVGAVLGQADLLLSVRGHLTTQRGSVIAGIACGLPLVAYSGPQTGYPVTEAGVMLVPQGDREALSRAVVQVLADRELLRKLRRRSQDAHQDYFSWFAIGDRLLKVLSEP